MGITQIIYDMYERYHVEALKNAFDDIEELEKISRKAIENKV